ncbi:MAG TPA: hypothetical protein VKD65_15565 [Candidatus Angelobacter sp.]|nr:hypothetical protein [Candidatus Angelobacter sp.]
MTPEDFRRLKELKQKMVAILQEDGTLENTILEARMDFEIRVLEYRLNLEIEELAQKLFLVGLQYPVMRVSQVQKSFRKRLESSMAGIFSADPQVVDWEAEAVRTGDPIEDVHNVKLAAYKLATRVTHERLGAA